MTSAILGSHADPSRTALTIAGSDSGGWTSVRFVIDPVAAFQYGNPLLRPDALAALRDLIIALATLITPSLGGIGLITGIGARDRAGMRAAPRALHGLGPRSVLVKGSHLPSDEPVDLLFDGPA